MSRLRRHLAGTLLIPLLVGSCRAPEPGPDPAAASAPGSILVAGQRFPIEVPVVHWFEAPHYSAYAVEPRFAPVSTSGGDAPTGLRYRPGRATDDEARAERIAERGMTLDDTRALVRGFLVHYDVCGTSEQCFRVLQDWRGLSVHFLCDVDGTLYQTLDVADQAWHAASANPWTVGVEVAQIGAYRVGGIDGADVLARWYAEDEQGLVLTIPEPPGTDALRTPNFVGRPARTGWIEGEVHGAPYVQADFTNEQYESLAALAAALHEALPRIRLEVPRDAAGDVRTDALNEAELAEYEGLLGHSHTTTRKNDPGPAFDWERVLDEARALTTEP